MERPQKTSKGTPGNGVSRQSSKSRGSSEQKSKDSNKRKATDKDESDSEENPQPLAEVPRPKTVKKPRISLKSDDGNADSEDTGAKLQTNGEGERYVDLGKKKRVTVRSFKGMTLVDIREYYGAEDDEKPGKKGISLTVEQWKALMQASRTISGLL